MAHPEQEKFFELVSARWRLNESHRSSQILEIGSYDVNGSVRKLFSGCAKYFGVDLVAGPGVDFVGRGHELPESLGPFDVCIATEVFEHDRFWQQTFRRMYELLAPGGAMLISCASLARPEHGTVRSDKNLSPGTAAIQDDYYKNISEAEFRIYLQAFNFEDEQVRYLPWSADLYFIGVKPSAERAAKKDTNLKLLLTDAEFKQISSMMSFTHRLVRVPLLAASKALGNETLMSEVGYWYWSSLRRFLKFLGLEKSFSRAKV